MPQLSRYSFNICEILLLIVLSLLTTNYLAPKFLNADVILNSIMSVQNITLFYWGQNRLLNVLPALTWIFSDPGLNLYACLVVTAMSFFSLLWLWSYLISNTYFDSQSFNDINKKIVRLNIFLLLVLTFFNFFNEDTLFEIIIGHIEYSLAYLILTVAFYLTLNIRQAYRFLIFLILIILCTGINNSIVVPSLAFIFFYLILRRDFKFTEALILFFCTICAFLIWAKIATLYLESPTAYSQFSLNGLSDAIKTSVKNLTDRILATQLIFILLLGLLIKLYLDTHSNTHLSKKIIASTEWTKPLLIFCVTWTGVFAANNWVAANGYHFRYFIPVIFACCICFALYLNNTLLSFGTAVNKVVLCSTTGYLIFFLSHPFIPLKNYPVFNISNFQEFQNVSGFAGDYWLAWPAVMRKLMEGQESFGFSYRGVSNTTNINNVFTSRYKNSTPFYIGCIKISTNQCFEDMKKILPMSTLLTQQQLNKDASIIKLKFQ